MPTPTLSSPQHRESPHTHPSLEMPSAGVMLHKPSHSTSEPPPVPPATPIPLPGLWPGQYSPCTEGETSLGAGYSSGHLATKQAPIQGLAPGYK